MIDFLLRIKIFRWIIALRDAIREINGIKDRLQGMEYALPVLLWRYHALCLEHWGQPEPHEPPPSEIPHELLESYTMGGRIPVEKMYADEVRPRNFPLIYTQAEIDYHLARIEKKKPFIYGETDLNLFEALEAYPVHDKSIVVMGSLSPWYESVCLFYGGKPTTIDYNPIISRVNGLETVSVEEFRLSPQKFDAAFSISSFEHDGLGKYGDPLDPDGDLKAMRNMKSMLLPGGLMYFAVPIGYDRLRFNDCRIYGDTRLPALLEGWEVVATFGMKDDATTATRETQPVMVLRSV